MRPFLHLFAYIGPGLGAGVVASILGILGSIFLALFVIIWYPIKRFFRRRKADNREQTPPSD